jgi:hypothetical protein
VTYDHDLILDRGKIRKRKKGASRQFRGAYGHTPLSAAEDTNDNSEGKRSHDPLIGRALRVEPTARVPSSTVLM